MRNCVFISCFDYYKIRIERLINFFERYGNYEISYLYADFDHFAKKDNENQYKYGKKIEVVKYNSNLSFQRLYSHYIFAKRVREFIEKIKADFIYCIIPPNYLVKELSDYKLKNPNVKLVFDVFDTWPESFPYSKYNKLLTVPFSLWKKLRSKYISRSDLVLCVSEQGKEYLLNETKETPVKVVKPTIIQGNMPNYNPQKNNLSFCYLGLVNHITDIDLGVELLAKLACNRHTTLHIIGEGLKLNEFVEKLNNKKVKVVCHGCIFDRDEKNRVFSLCNMGLNIPRKEIGSTMSLKAVEYMRVGLPFINNASGDIRDIVETDGIGINIKNNNIEELANKILNLDNKDYIQMNDNCIISYNKRFLSQNYEEIFDGLLR